MRLRKHDAWLQPLQALIARHPVARHRRRSSEAMREVYRLTRWWRRRGQRAARRRNRHRQGAHRPRRPPAQPARRRPLRPRQLRRAGGEPAGKRAVRPRQGRVHRRHRQQDRPFRGGPRRHDLPRRNLQHESEVAGQAAARPAGEASSSASARAAPSASIRASSRPPISTWKTRSRPAASATTCIIASTWCRSICRRCANAARTSPPLARYFLEQHSEENRRDPPELTPDVRQDAQAHDWPGNVRELENYIARAVVLSRGEPLTPDLLAPPGRAEANGRWKALKRAAATCKV